MSMARIKKRGGDGGVKNWVVLNGIRDNYSMRRQINE